MRDPMKVVLIYKPSSTFLSYLALNRPGTYKAYERLGKNTNCTITTVLNSYCRPTRFKVEFTFSNADLTVEESVDFDRQVDNNNACIVLDRHPDLCRTPLAKFTRACKLGDIMLVPADLILPAYPNLQVPLKLVAREAFIDTYELPCGDKVSFDRDELDCKEF